MASSVWGTLLGACLLYVLNYALAHRGMEDVGSDLFFGAILILSAVFDNTRSRPPQFVTRIEKRLSGV